MNKAQKYMMRWRSDWNLFVKEVLKADLDEEQKAIVSAVQHNKMVGCPVRCSEKQRLKSPVELLI